jgi:hypothetical protein
MMETVERAVTDVDSSAWWSTPSRGSIPIPSRCKPSPTIAADLLRDQQGRPRAVQERAAADHRALAERARVRRDRPDLGSRRRRTATGSSALLVNRLPEHPLLFPEDATSDQPETFYVAEIIREQIFHLTHQEVPYAAAVRVEELVERKRPECLYIRATIFVEQDSQRGS